MSPNWNGTQNGDPILVWGSPYRFGDSFQIGTSPYRFGIYFNLGSNIYAHAHFDTSVFQLFAYSVFSFYLLHLSFDCIVAEIVSFLSSKISGQEFPDSQMWVYSICGYDFCNPN